MNSITVIPRPVSLGGKALFLMQDLCSLEKGFKKFKADT